MSGYLQFYAPALSKIAEALNHGEADRRDAARYRWLRKRFVEYDYGWIAALKIAGAPSLEDFDDALDAAMQSSRSSNE